MIIRGLILTILLIGFVGSSSAYPENTIIDNIGLYIGFYKNTYTYSGDIITDFNQELYVSGEFDLEEVVWYVDGLPQKREKSNRTSTFNPKKMKLMSVQDTTSVYKAGKDKATNRYIHKVMVQHSGGERTWFLLE